MEMKCHSRKRILICFCMILLMQGCGNAAAEERNPLQQKAETTEDASVKNADSGFIMGNYNYSILEDDSVKILKYTGKEDVVFIPDQLGGRTVSVIGEAAFQNNGKVRQAVLPAGVSVIEERAFEGCPELQYIFLSTEVRQIGYRAFGDCQSLEEITFPEGLTDIGAGICEGCTGLKKIVLPKSLNSIDETAFDQCEELQLVYGESEFAEAYAEKEGKTYVDFGRIREEDTGSLKQTIQQEQPSDENLYGYEVDLEEIPELRYRNISDLEIGENYICYGDTLILGNTIYKKEKENYIKQEETLNNLFGIADGLAVRCIQYKNLLITAAEDEKSFLLYDMDTELKYNYPCIGEDMDIGPFWYVYDDCIFYSEWDSQYVKERTLRQINLLNHDNKEIYRPEKEKGEGCVFGEFRIRNDGTIMYGIYDKAEGCREYWKAEKDKNGEWEEKKIWETKEWEYAYVLDFNQYGFIVFGEFYYPKSTSSYYEIVAIRDNGEVIKINDGSKGKYLFMDNGYFWSNAAELENMPWDEDELLSQYLADSVSFYDYEGNQLKTCQMVSADLLEQGYYLKKLIYNKGKLTGFYVQKETEELYISQSSFGKAGTAGTGSVMNFFSFG